MLKLKLSWEMDFFYGVLKTLRDSIRYLYDNPAVTYTQLLAGARKAEAEEWVMVSQEQWLFKPKLLQPMMSWSVWNNKYQIW